MANTLQLIKTVTADGNSATMDSGTLTGDLDVLRVVIEIVGGGSGGCRMRFNGNTGNNYRRLFSENGGSKDGHNDGAGNGVTNMVGRVGRHCYSTTTIYNYDGKESHGHGHCVTDGANTGSANAPTRMEYAFKWAETDQINRIAIESYSSNWTSGSTMNIYAFSRTDADISNEKDALTNVEAGTRYEETDTRKIYRSKQVGFASGTSGSGSDWTEVAFDSSTSVNNTTASGNVVSRSSGSGWDSYIRSTTHYLDPSEGGGEVYFTVSSSSTASVGLEKSPYNQYPSATYTDRNYSFHTTTATNNIYEKTSDYDGTDWNNATNEWRITMDSAGLIKYYYRVNSSGSWNLERTSTVTASGKYYVSVSPHSNATCTCFIKSSSQTLWAERGTA
jgi:hypothetical protein